MTAKEQQDIKILKAQNATLLAACKALMDEVELKYRIQGSYGHFAKAMKQAQAAIKAGEA